VGRGAALDRDRAGQLHRRRHFDLRHGGLLQRQIALGHLAHFRVPGRRAAAGRNERHRGEWNE
jgi:hypothetical protein